jgi:DNA-binding beta-propeller fold protein YncE
LKSQIPNLRFEISNLKSAISSSKSLVGSLISSLCVLCAFAVRSFLRSRWLLTALAVPLMIGCQRDSISGRSAEKIIGDQGLGPGQFYNPRAMATGPDGAVYVVDKTARIQRFSPEGEYEISWRTPEWQKGKPTGLTVDSHNRVLVADTHYHRVLIYDRDGGEIARFGSEGDGAGQFQLPTDVEVDSDGYLYVGEYGGNDRISKYTPDYQFVTSFGGPDAGEASLQRPQAIKIDGQNVLWVADALHHRICRFSRDGKFLSSFGTAGDRPGQLKYPYDLALCPDGTLLVCEYGNNRVQRFDAGGKSLEIWGAAGRRPGELASPWGMALGKDHRVYVVDYLNHRVQMFHM